MEMFQAAQKRLIQRLLANPKLGQRVERLAGIPGVGEITALTWALETGDPRRFSSSAKMMSYCSLTGALRSSADKQQRGPISTQGNQWLQTALIAAKLALLWNPPLAALHARELERGHRNRATLAVARKLAAYLLAVDKRGQPFQLRALPTSEITLTLDKAGYPRAVGIWKSSQPRLDSHIPTAPTAATKVTSDSSAIHQPFLAVKGDCARGVLAPDAPTRLFRGRPVHPNSIFVDSATPLLPIARSTAALE